MCGKFTWMLSWAEVHYLSGLTGGADSPGMSDADYAAAEAQGKLRRATPNQRAPIWHLNEAGDRTVTAMTWGWPKTFEDKSGRNLHMHAVGETIRSRKTFAEAFERRRGIAWSLDFNEGATEPGGIDHQIVCSTPGRQPIAIAVVYQVFPNAPGEPPDYAFCMVTIEENAQLHDLGVRRMPALLNGEDDIALWLGEQRAPLEEVHAVLRPYPGELIVEHMPPPRSRGGKGGRDKPPPTEIHRPKLFD